MTGCNGEKGSCWDARLSNEGGITEECVFCSGGTDGGEIDEGGSCETGGGATGFIIGGGWLNACGPDDIWICGFGTNMGLGWPLGRW